VVTSGDYEKHVTFDGKWYTHILNPRTGFPATDILSVTVFATKAELADALATSAFVMGIVAGQPFSILNKKPRTLWVQGSFGVNRR